MMFECSVMAPFGGVFILPLNSNIPGYIISILVGIVAGTIIYGIIKKKPEEEKVTPQDVVAAMKVADAISREIEL